MRRSTDSRRRNKPTKTPTIRPPNNSTPCSPCGPILAIGGWAEAVLKPIPGIEVSPGRRRVDLYGEGSTTALGVDPRISARTAVTKHVRFIQAYGLAHQALSFHRADPRAHPGSLKDGLQKAFQTSAGVEADLARRDDHDGVALP